MTSRIIILSDIHGNLPALQAVMNALPSHDAVFVAGDLCLEGPSPAHVLDVVNDAGWTLIQGNTDRDIALRPADMKPLKAARVAWTRDQIGAAGIELLHGLPFSERYQQQEDRVLVVHANPIDLRTHLFPTLSNEQLAPYLEDIDADILAFGHFHIPYVRPVHGVVLVDVSSVGHPKDLDPRAAFTVISWDDGRRSLEQVRVPYDIEETVRQLRTSDMPGAEEQIASLLAASY